jgi:hypothetical protein
MAVCCPFPYGVAGLAKGLPNALERIRNGLLGLKGFPPKVSVSNTTS